MGPHHLPTTGPHVRLWKVAPCLAPQMWGLTSVARHLQEPGYNLGTQATPAMSQNWLPTRDCMAVEADVRALTL